MEWTEIFLVIILFVAIIDMLNNWRLGSKLSGKSAEEINTELERAIQRVDFIASNQIQKSKQLDEKLSKKISELNTTVASIKRDINDILETYNHFSQATTAIKIYTLYLYANDATIGKEARIQEFLEYVDSIPEELKDLKSFANTLKAKLEADNKINPI